VTTSGTYTYNPNVNTIINRALRQCSAITQGEVPPAADQQDALDALNAMVKEWQAGGINVWAEITGTIFLQPKQTVYQIGAGTTDAIGLNAPPTNAPLFTTLTANASGASLAVASIAGMAAGMSIGVQLSSGVNFWTTISGAPSGFTVALAASLPSGAAAGALVFFYSGSFIRPLRVPFARRYTLASQISNPLIVMSRLDYQALSNQYNTGTVTQFYFDPQLQLAQFTVWPAPVDNTDAIIFTAQRPLQDLSNVGNTLDFPVEWVSAVAWNLAVELAPEYDVPMERFQLLKLQAASAKTVVSGWNKEPEPLLFGVAFQPGYR
jgi:hypothetical protein